MLLPGDIFIKILEFICYIALVVLVAAGLGYGVLYVYGECQGYLFDPKSCSNAVFAGIANYSYTVILGTMFTFFPAVFALGGVFAILRNIHHNKTMRLLDEGRVDDVIKLRVFLLRILFVVALIVLAIVLGWTLVT